MGAEACSRCLTIETSLQSQVTRALTRSLTHREEQEDNQDVFGSRSNFASKNNARVFDTKHRLEDADSEHRRTKEKLIQGSRAGRLKVCVEAIAEGADIHCRTLRQQTPLMLVAGSHSREAKETMKFLMDTMADVEAKDESGWTPLLHACRNNQQEAVEELLDVGASLKARSIDGKTAVMLAAMDSADKLVEVLLRKKAQIDKKDERGWSVLFFACEDGRHELVKWLLKRQANARDKSKDLTTPLMVAAENGIKKIGVKLLKKGANINAKNVQGNTALMLSLRAQKEEFADWLLEEGADVTAKNQDEEDALEIAELLGMHSIKNKLEMKARLANEEVVAAAGN